MQTASSVQHAPSKVFGRIASPSRDRVEGNREGQRGHQAAFGARDVSEVFCRGLTLPRPGWGECCRICGMGQSRQGSTRVCSGAGRPSFSRIGR
jgi:hypothetical protein